MKWKGKVSWWFYAVMAGIAAVLLCLIFFSAFVDLNAAVLISCLFIFILTETFCISIAFHNFVLMRQESLYIVFGFIKKEIPYQEIVAISTTHNPCSSLAASLDRIEIKCRRTPDTVMVSLRDKARFLQEMKKYVPAGTILA